MTRAERAAEAARLRETGLTVMETAAALGVGYSYVRSLLYDPDGTKEKARRERYRGVCPDCGGPKSGGHGKSKTPERCAACAHGLPRTPPREPGKRRCAGATCITILSVYNSEPLCGPCRLTAAREAEAKALEEARRAGESGPSTAEQRCEQIIALLSAGGPLSASELAADLSIGKKRVQEYLRQLTRDGLVACETPGAIGRRGKDENRYSLPEDYEQLMGAA